MHLHFSIIIAFMLFIMNNPVQTLMDINETDYLALLSNQLEMSKIFYENVKIRMQALKQFDRETLTDITAAKKPLPIFDIRFDKLPRKCENYSTPTDCTEATACTGQSGIYQMFNPAFPEELFFGYCEDVTDGGDWLIIQNRKDGTENFYRSWLDYKFGFGKLQGDYWFGLSKLYFLTNFFGPHELYIHLEDYNNTARYAKYDNFQIASEKDKYKLTNLGLYSGTAGDSMSKNNLGMYFSTHDSDNDETQEQNCAVERHGAWWYSDCSDSNPNGKYYYTSKAEGQKGIFWLSWHGVGYSYKHIKMMIRRTRK